MVENKPENKVNSTKEKNAVNYYKISTIVLLTIIVVIGAFYVFSWYENRSYNQGFVDGQIQTVNVLLGAIVNEGSVDVAISDNESVTLVPFQLVEQVRQSTFEETLNSITELALTEGSVVITNDNESITLFLNQ